MPLNEECIIVTGASGNLGSVVARMLARKGARVACVDRTERKFDLRVDGIDPDRILWIADADVSDKRAMDHRFAAREDNVPQLKGQRSCKHFVHRQMWPFRCPRSEGCIAKPAPQVTAAGSHKNAGRSGQQSLTLDTGVDLANAQERPLSI